MRPERPTTTAATISDLLQSPAAIARLTFLLPPPWKHPKEIWAKENTKDYILAGLPMALLVSAR